MTAWHVAPDVLNRYAAEPELVDDTTASSLELHLLRCDQCRAALSAASDSSELELSWGAVADRIDLPRRTPVERLLRLFGFSESSARIVAATRALQLSWLAAMAAVIVGSVVLAQRADDPGPFLVIAPIVPLAAVVLAFAPGADPAGEAGSAAPMSTFALVLRRGVVVLSVSFVAVAIASVAVPDVHATDAGWMLPALGLSIGALALATWVRVEIAAVALGGVWMTVLFASAIYEPEPVLVPNLLPFAVVGQVACALLALGGALVLITWRDSFTTLRRAL